MVTMDEFIDAANDGRIIEVFGCGTACMVAPIHSILYNGKVYLFSVLFVFRYFNLFLLIVLF